MRSLLLILALFSFNVYAKNSAQKTEVNENGIVSVAETKKSSTSAEKKGSDDTVESTSNENQMHGNANRGGTASDRKEGDAQRNILSPYRMIVISVVGQGVAPVNTTSPAQAFALAKRAAIADGYRLIAEKIKGVEIEGQDLIRNMMVKRSTVRTAVYAKIKNANIVETNFRDGLCEVEMEIRLYYKDFVR